MDTAFGYNSTYCLDVSFEKTLLLFLWPYRPGCYTHALTKPVSITENDRNFTGLSFHYLGSIGEISIP